MAETKSYSVYIANTVYSTCILLCDHSLNNGLSGVILLYNSNKEEGTGWKLQDLGSAWFRFISELNEKCDCEEEILGLLIGLH